MIYKLKLNIYKENGEGEVNTNDGTMWSNLYLDVTKIIGFRVYDYSCTEKKDQASFIYTPGDVFLIKNEPHIMEYLLKTFVDKAIEYTIKNK